MFVDEAAFHLLPAAVRTYAPRGKTPILCVPYSRDHLSVISGITLTGQLFHMTRQQAFKAADIIRFLKHLLRLITGPILLIWDRLPAHRSQLVKDFLASGAATRLHLEQLPPYAPDLNPDEGIWAYLKQVALPNLCCLSLADLRYHLYKAIRRLRAKPHLIQACFRILL